MANIHHLAEKQPEVCSILKQIGVVAESKDKEVKNTNAKRDKKN